MKRFFALLLTAALMLTCFAACGGSVSETDTTAPDSAATDASQNMTANTKLKDTTADEDIAFTKNSFASFAAVDLKGTRYDQSLFKDKKLTMINIWATFCGPCINEMPDLQTISEEYSDGDDFQIIGIVCDVTKDTKGFYDESLLSQAKAITDELGITYISLLPSASLDGIMLNEVYSVPTTVFVDSEGNIVGENSYVGARSYDNWQTIIKGLLETL
ncbi:MAG: TlpA family protein disulfide reductase [Acutalibacteraceae bacterium]